MSAGSDAAQGWSAERILDADRRYVIHSWSTQGNLNPKVIEGGEGSWFWDSTGKRYLDFQSQLVNLNLGHQHPGLVRAVQEAAAEMCYMGPGFAVRSRAALAERMAEITPGDLRMTFFTTGGAEANEAAVRLARNMTGRHKIVARYRSYHGATAGALALTGDPRRWAGEPYVSGVVRMFDPDPYRLAPDDPVNLGGPHLEEVLKYEGPDTVAAVIVEPVTGTNGILYPPDGYLASIREVCDRHGIVLIFDEVMVGFGRTGELFACNHWDVVPDILVTAKGLNSGYVPLGAMTVDEPISQWLQDNHFWAGQTYAGHPLACASGLAALDIIESEGVMDNVRWIEGHLDEGLAKIAAAHPSVGNVRGRGAFFGVELVRDQDTKEPLVAFNAKGAAAEPMTRVCKAAMDAGLYITSNNNVLRLAPPLTISIDDVDIALGILDEVLSIADTYTTDGGAMKETER